MTKIVVVNGDSMGQGDEKLGRQILGSFFRKVAAQDSKPDGIIFYNSGVKLMAVGSPFLADLKILEQQGIDLIACGTCIGYFSLSDKMSVGRVSQMQEIARLLVNTESIVTL